MTLPDAIKLRTAALGRMLEARRKYARENDRVSVGDAAADRQRVRLAADALTGAEVEYAAALGEQRRIERVCGIGGGA